jgi:hypothetical protein
MDDPPSVPFFLAPRFQNVERMGSWLSSRVWVISDPSSAKGSPVVLDTALLVLHQAS